MVSRTWIGYLGKTKNWKELERFWEQETGGKGLTIYDKKNLPPELVENFLTKFPEYNYMFEGSEGGRAGYMGGGITGIRRPSALPPTGGPQSGGLPSCIIMLENARSINGRNR